MPFKPREPGCTKPIRPSMARELEKIAKAADAGEIAPSTRDDHIRDLLATGHVRVEVYSLRVIHILKGDHAGKSTKSPLVAGLKPHSVFPQTNASEGDAR